MIYCAPYNCFIWGEVTSWSNMQTLSQHLSGELWERVLSIKNGSEKILCVYYSCICKCDARHSIFSAEFKYKTKQADNGLLRHPRDLGLEMTQDSFRLRAAKSYNELPLNIRNIASLEAFKKGAKAWIKLNTSLHPDWTSRWTGHSRRKFTTPCIF